MKTEKFWYSAITLFMFGLITRSLILKYSGINVFTDTFSPVSLSYYFSFAPLSIFVRAFFADLCGEAFLIKDNVFSSLIKHFKNLFNNRSGKIYLGGEITDCSFKQAKVSKPKIGLSLEMVNNTSPTDPRSDTPKTTTSSTTTSGSRFTDLSEVKSVAAASRNGSDISGYNSQKPRIPPIGSVSNLTDVEAREMYIRLQRAYVHPYPTADLIRRMERSANDMPLSEIKEAIRNVRHVVQHDPAIPNQNRQDTPPNTSSSEGRGSSSNQS